MWIEKVGDKCRAVERYEDYATGRPRRVSVMMDRDTSQQRRIAQDILYRKIECKKNGNRNNKVTLQQLVDVYLDKHQLDIKESTYQRNKYACKSLINILGGNSIISRYNATYVRDRFISTGESGARLNERLKRFKALIRWGYINDLVEDKSFLDKLEPFKDTSKKKTEEERYLEFEDLQIVLDAIKLEHWRLLTKFLALSGLRIGEALALDKKDFDYEKRIIKVANTLFYNSKKENNIGDTKTVSSNREIYMQEDLVDVCKEIDRYMLKLAHYNGVKSKYFMHNKNGARLGYRAYGKALKEVGIEMLGSEYITPHILRHTHTCLLAENDVQLETISERLGHADSKITADVYHHVTLKMREKRKREIQNVKLFQ